ncbi:MAG: putative toxin-antitoxin system toxin component, PIN family [Microgenomates group bacterium]
MSQYDKEAIINELTTKSIKINPPPQINICRDKKDNQILNLCFTGKANYLITEDKDLLILKKFKNTKIVAPKRFLKIKRNRGRRDYPSKQLKINLKTKNK